MDVDGETRVAKRRSNSPFTSNMPQASTNGSDQPPTFLQRASRICYICQETFSPIETQSCANCGHLRCPKCFREPAHPYSEATLPDGPSNQLASSSQNPDRVYRVPRQRIRWICDQCETDFEPDSTVCSACLHDRCNNCTRIAEISSLHTGGLVQSSSQTELRLDSSVDLDLDPDITASMQSHIHDFAVLHTPVIIASGSGT
jgi:hypothetical protein